MSGDAGYWGSSDTRPFEGDVSFDYKLFSPGKEGPLPVVIVFHGFGDTSNLLSYRTAVEWAEPQNQAVRPCYVLAPSVDDAT